MTTLMLSLHPEYTKAILSGRKLVEFRKRSPRRIATGDTILLYTTSPVCALVGTATYAGLIEATPKKLWSRFGQVGGIEKADFDSYFKNSKNAFGLQLASPRKLRRPIDLLELRTVWRDFWPPQQFLYVDPAVQKLLQLDF